MLPEPPRHHAPTAIPLECTCPTCRKPFATLEGDVLFVQVRHDGETHRSRISLYRLATLAGLRLVPMDTPPQPEV